MSTTHVALGLLLLSVLNVASVDGCLIYVKNQCSYPVTACAQSSYDKIYQYNLQPGAYQPLDFGPACKWPTGVIHASVKGQCSVSGKPNSPTDRTLANLAQFTIGANSLDFYDINNAGATKSGSESNGLDWYNLSNVNAYTIGMAIRPHREGCKAVSCNIPDIRKFCRPNNQLVTFPTGALSCVNTDGSRGLGPTAGTKLFKEACQSAYSFPYDDATSSFTCPSGTNYDVIFCPSYNSADV